MQNPQILKIIESLKGRRNYEEKKASKLGFNSLYAYFENKLLQKKTAFEESIKYDIQMAGGLKSMVFGGEGLFLATLSGFGTVWLQSLPF